MNASGRRIAARAGRLRIPGSAASRYCSGSRKRLWVTSLPSGTRATTSVTFRRVHQNCQPVAVIIQSPAFRGRTVTGGGKASSV